LIEEVFISGTINGIFLSYLKTDELSITFVQLFIAIGAHFLEIFPQAQNNVKSTVLNEFLFTALTIILPKGVSNIFHSERGDASNVNFFIGISNL
jgi:hypothetical protein